VQPGLRQEAGSGHTCVTWKNCGAKTTQARTLAGTPTRRCRAAEPSASHVVSPFRFGNIVDPFEKEFAVVRELRCADLMSGCDFVAQGKDDSEVMKKTAEHAKSVHKMIAISMDVEKKARASIRDAAGGAG